MQDARGSRSWMKKRMQPTLREKTPVGGADEHVLDAHAALHHQKYGDEQHDHGAHGEGGGEIEGHHENDAQKHGRDGEHDVDESVLRCSDDSSALRRFSSNLSGRTMTNQLWRRRRRTSRKDG